MNTQDFATYKARYRTAIRTVLAQAERGRLDEAAFPAYTHRNPLINWLFWQRLRVVMTRIQLRTPYGLVLDFGCGSGVMLPFLSQVSSRVVAMDVDLLPLERVRAHFPLAPNVEVRDAGTFSLRDLTPDSLDMIVALDVLEHVKDLSGTLRDMLVALKPGGHLIVSGPTENFLYRIGRKIAGPEYSGAYHERGMAEIRTELGRLVPVESIATLYWPVPLFEIISATKR